MNAYAKMHVYITSAKDMYRQKTSRNIDNYFRYHLTAYDVHVYLCVPSFERHTKYKIGTTFCVFYILCL